MYDNSLGIPVDRMRRGQVQTHLLVGPLAKWGPIRGGKMRGHWLFAVFEKEWASHCLGVRLKSPDLPLSHRAWAPLVLLLLLVLPSSGSRTVLQHRQQANGEDPGQRCAAGPCGGSYGLARGSPCRRL